MFRCPGEAERVLRRNIIANLLDGGFFGFAIGFASFVTVIPLFVKEMTDSAILIGLVPTLHSAGWQYPQLFTAQMVSRLRRYKPFVLLMTIQERVPFLGLAVVAFFLPRLGIKAALWLTFVMLAWQGLGAGFTANAWQSMIGKIIPPRRRGLFFGFQSSTANILASGSTISAGLILERVQPPLNYTLCFLLASVAMLLSFFSLAFTCEEEHHPPPTEESDGSRAQRVAYWNSIWKILQKDTNFRWFLTARMLTAFGMMASAFYTVYAVDHHGMTAATAGLMGGVLSVTGIFANPLLGWMGDRMGHRPIMAFGALAAAISALLAWWAPSLGWFTLVFILSGIANVSTWTIAMSITLEFGSETERPAYIGMANTLIAPAATLAPLIGGWLADASDYSSTFLVSAICALATTLVLFILVKDPHPPNTQLSTNG